MSPTITRLAALSALALATVVAGNASSVAAGGGCRGVPLTAASGDQVRMTGHSCFTPTVLYVESGTAVTWTNDTDDIHDVAGAPSGWGSYEEIRRGERVTHRFEQPGTFPYYCFVHPGMTGVIVVGDGRAATTAAQAVSADAVAVSESRDGSALAPSGEQPGQALASAPGQADRSGERLAFAGLGVLIGAVVVSLGVSARRIRRASDER